MKNKLTARELSSFCGQMGMLLHSGISTAEGLHILCDESKTDADRQILTPLIRSVEENGSLSRALDESGIFPTSMTAYVRTGEETGCLDEIMESLNIIEQLIDNIPEGPFQEKMKPIIRVPEGSYYAAVEGSRGEFGVYLESRGDKTPYRLHYRSTGLPLVSVVDTICRGAKIADLIAIGGTLDYVVPDIDR